MTPAEVDQLVASIELPKNFHIDCQRATVRGELTPVVMIYARWPDLYDETKHAQTYSSVYVHEWLKRDFVIEYIYEQVELLWLHELHEFFKVDGEWYHHPHPQGVKGPLG